MALSVSRPSTYGQREKPSARCPPVWHCGRAWTELSAEEALEKIREVLVQTPRRRHVRHAVGAFGEWAEPHLAVITEIRGHLDRLQEQINGFDVLPSPPPTCTTARDTRHGPGLAIHPSFNWS